MAIKDILVYVDAAERCQALLQSAVALAQAHQAKLIGIHISEPASYALYADVPIPAQLIEQDQQRLAALAAKAHGAFQSATRNQLEQCEWRNLEGDRVRELTIHARYADLCLMQLRSSTVERDPNLALVEELVIGSGKPVLVLPEDRIPPSLGSNITVGWDGGREAVRALTDAIPLLREAQSVSVVAIDPDDIGLQPLDIPAADICQFLARHGVRAQAQTAQSHERSKGQALLDWAAGQGSDLLIMGAYGHTRLRELLLGGVTRLALREMRMPLLLSC